MTEDKLKGRCGRVIVSNINNLIYLAVAVVIFSFVLIHSLNKFDRTTDALDNSALIPLTAENCIEQDITVPCTMSASSLNILFETFGRTNEGLLSVRLFKENSEVFSWVTPTSSVTDEQYCVFRIDPLMKMEKGEVYTVRITEQYSGENGISVYKNEERNSICYSLTYPDQALKTAFITISILVFLFVVISMLLHWDNSVIMPVLLIVLFAAYLWVCRPGMAPDEGNHFCRAFEISQGSMLSEHIGKSGEGGNLLPSNIRDYANREAILSEDLTETEFGNASLFSPVSYLPQVIGILFTRIFSSKTFDLFCGGKIGNAVCSLVLCMLALRLVPFGKKLFFLIMTFPMSLQEMVSIAPDGFTISLSLFFIALVFRLAYSDEKVSGKQLALLMITGCVIALVKIVYIVLILLVLLIPNEKFRTVKTAFWFKIGSICLAMLLNVVWLFLSSGYLVEFYPGVDSFAQIRNVLGNVAGYYMVIIRTFISALTYYASTMIGSIMGALDVEISNIAWFITVILLVFETCSCDVFGFRIRAVDSFLLIFVFISGVVLIMTSIYVQWTPYMAAVIEGVQGRYFIPLMPLLLTFTVFVRRKAANAELSSVRESNGRYYYLLILLCNSITFLDTAYYYIDSL